MITTIALYIILAMFIVIIVKYTIDMKFYINCSNSVCVNVGYIVLFLTLMFFALFRYVDNGYGGTDAYSYVTQFQEFNVPLSFYLDIKRIIYFWNYSETLFKVITLAIREITSDYHIYFLFTYGIIVSGLLAFVYHFYRKKSHFFSLILLFCSYLHSYNVMRGWISVAICMFALIAIDTKKWKKAFVLIIIASSFHYMSLVYILIWGVCWFHNKYPNFFTRNKLIVCVILCNVFALVGRTILYNIVMQTRYYVYKDYFNMQVSVWGYLTTFLICAVVIIFYPKLKERGENTSNGVVILAINLALFYCIVYLPGWRLHDYFAPIRMYMLSELYVCIPKLFKKGVSRTILRVLINTYIILLFVQSLMGLYESSDVFPYILCI